MSELEELFINIERVKCEKQSGGGDKVVYYRLSNNEDPEERLEDAALWKAMKDEYGDDIGLLRQDEDIPRGKIMFGRTRRGEMYSSSGNATMNYWSDPEFLGNCEREFYLCDFNSALRMIDDLHARGKGAFVKATDRKLYTQSISVGLDAAKAIGDMAYSFMDRPPSIMVQELCDIEFEQRFIFIDRELAASSPVAWHLTPLDWVDPNFFWRTPNSKEAELAPEKNLREFAKGVARECQFSNVNIDCAFINGKPGVVEFNDCHLGQLGLYACNVRALAKASRKLIPKE